MEHALNLGPMVAIVAIAVALVSISARIGLGTVIGYLAAGLVVGPAALGLITDVGVITRISEIGVVLLLFVIGLELERDRLRDLATEAARLGGVQMGVSMLLIGLLFWLVLDITPIAAACIGFALALSSTALALQLLGERRKLGSPQGARAFSILLFQDLIVIPGLITLSVLAPSAGHFHWGYFGAGVVFAVVLVLAGRGILQQMFRLVAVVRSRELFTASALLVVIAVAYGMEVSGLSMGLGAFLAGLALSDTEFRHELETVIDPFKGLLLGLFFLSVGMTIDLSVLSTEAVLVLSAAVGLVVIKASVILLIGKFDGLSAAPARELAITLSQGGEFGFVILSQAAAGSLIDARTASIVVLVVILSMIATPLLLKIMDAMLVHQGEETPEESNPELSEHPRVIIAGFGRYGQIIGRLLFSQDVNFTAIDRDARHVDFVRQFGNEIYFGDASRLDLLQKAHATAAKVLVIAVDDTADSLKIAELAKDEFPHLSIVARARDRLHAYELMEMGIKVVHRATFASSLESAEQVLRELGFPTAAAIRARRRFRRHDEEMMVRAAPHHKDMDRLIEIAKQGREELRDLFSKDSAGQD